jgi:hypothetical protein
MTVMVARYSSEVTPTTWNRNRFQIRLYIFAQTRPYAALKCLGAKKY